MTKRTLTLEQARELLHRAVAEKGADYVYTSRKNPQFAQCVYVENGQPSCIIGHVVNYLGVPLDAIKEGVGPDQVLSDAGITAESTTAKLLHHAQLQQDQGIPWGQAVAIAERIVGK